MSWLESNIMVSGSFYRHCDIVGVPRLHCWGCSFWASQRLVPCSTHCSLQHVRLGWEVYDRCFHASGDEKISVGGCIATLLGFCSYTDMLIGTHERVLDKRPDDSWLLNPFQWNTQTACIISVIGYWVGLRFCLRLILFIWFYQSLLSVFVFSELAQT